MEQYNELFIKQNGCCKMADINLNSKEDLRRLAVDHCHQTKKIRGLLCHHCNQGIGAFFEDISIMNQAIAYIKETVN